jgi:hypothetical protein
VAQTPPGRPVRLADGQLIADHPTEPTHWSLDALVSAAHQAGIAIKRSQVRRILLKEGVHWRQVRSWALSKDPNFVPKGQRRVEAYTHPAGAGLDDPVLRRIGAGVRALLCPRAGLVGRRPPH